MATTGIDYVALSGHKLYAPFGAGALAGRSDWLAAGEPTLAGGGAVRFVSSPAVPGAVRLSIGLGTRSTDIDRLVTAVEQIAVEGPRWTYRSSPDGKDCWPDPDPRPRPHLPFAIV